MAITVAEDITSRRKAPYFEERVCIVIGTADNGDAWDAVEASAAAPATIGGLVRGDMTLDPVHVDEDDADGCIWKATVPYNAPGYVKPEPPETGDSSLSFEIGGGTQHVTQALAHVADYAAPAKTAENFGGSICVSRQGEVPVAEGVDIPATTMTICETHYIADADVTEGYVAALFYLAWHTNNAAWRGFAAGEVLFEGASGAKRGAGDWEVTFRFAVSPNKTAWTVGGVTGITKAGWDFLWFDYKPKTGNKSYVLEPIAAHVERLYDSGNFADLVP